MKGDRVLILIYLDSSMPIFDFGHLQEVNWGQSQATNSNLGTVKTLCKSLSFSKSFDWNLCNYENCLWSKFQLNLTLLTGVIAPKPPKMDPIGSWTKKTLLFFLCKVEKNKYPEAETWYPESKDGCSYYRLWENFW